MMHPDVRIFLVRHGLSEANMDKTVNRPKPDHAIELASAGHRQAYDAGRILAQHMSSSRSLSEEPRRIRLLVSPYLRTRQTANGLERALSEEGMIFDRREVPELREISFGLYDGLSDDELAAQMPNEHAHYAKHIKFDGEYFAPMPMGESRIQVGDRVKSGTFGTILRDAEIRADDEETGRRPILDFVVVSHGVTIRQFRHRWMHYPWEWAEKEPNPGNCAIQLLQGRSGRGWKDTELFEGFPHVRGDKAQERREDGSVA
jgi:2,3-bisphosphoglycerate-dependent phosphoglycerate mutase